VPSGPGGPGPGGPLPFVDTHSVVVPAARDTVWAALQEYVARSLLMSDRHPLGLVLGTEPRAGFAVTETVPAQRLMLSGRHRFSRYRLTFELSDAPGGPGNSPATVLRAVTDAAFPGVHGRAYRALVIGTGGHSVATNRILRAVRRRALEAG
jgi:hypothetical protein